MNKISQLLGRYASDQYPSFKITLPGYQDAKLQTSGMPAVESAIRYTIPEGGEIPAGQYHFTINHQGDITEALRYPLGFKTEFPNRGTNLLYRGTENESHLQRFLDGINAGLNQQGKIIDPNILSEPEIFKLAEVLPGYTRLGTPYEPKFRPRERQLETLEFVRPKAVSTHPLARAIRWLAFRLRGEG